MELSEIFVELTLAHLNPNLAHLIDLVDIAVQSRQAGHEVAEQMAGQHATDAVA
jgi:FMN-dependent NADH-azoreductase